MAKEKRSGSKPSNSGKAAKSRKGGTFMGIRIVDPPVRPRGATVREIRRAVATVLASRKRA
jgi:hypothetical protein